MFVDALAIGLVASGLTVIGLSLLLVLLPAVVWRRAVTEPR